MPKFALEISVNLENLSSLSADSQTDFRWYLKLKCSNCGETPDHWHYVCLQEETQVAGSRGSAHFVEKCKLCGRQNTLEILSNLSPLKYSSAHLREFQRLVVFDCRGLEPVDYEPRMGWTAEAAEGSSTVFRNVDLSAKEWCEYDEKASCPVEVNEWRHRFTTVHDKK